MKSLLVCLSLTALALSASVPCTKFQPSKLGTASDCSITRIDDNTLQWGVQINFDADYKWTETSTYNVLADMGSPRLPVEADQSDCKTQVGSYTKGQSVLVNCTQSFSMIPVGYANVITAFDGADYPLGFSIKIPLSSSNSLQTE